MSRPGSIERAPRPTRRLFTDLARWMVGLGLLAGIAFPFLATLLGLPPEEVYTPRFFGATLLAGLAVGLANYGLARGVVRPRLRLLSGRMHQVAESIGSATYSDDWSRCRPETCSVPVDSQDELGESAAAFNRLVGALMNAHEVEDAVRDFSRELSGQLELAPLAARALTQLLNHTGAQAGAVLVEQGGELNVIAGHGLEDRERLRHSDHVREALRSQALRRLELPEDIVIEALVGNLRPREVVVVPIVYQSVNLGVVVLASTRPLTGERLRLLELFQRSFGLALHNAVTYDHLERLAALDPLTGAYNRRFGLGRLHEEYQRSARTRAPLGVLMLDIDHFKAVNDTYGHLVGDRVIASTANAIRRCLREGDVLVRYGGEEFLVLLPGAGCVDAQRVAERIRHACTETPVRDGEQTIQVTISGGYTAFPEQDAGDEDALIRSADTALYAAKAGGRNRIAAGECPPSQSREPLAQGRSGA